MVSVYLKQTKVIILSFTLVLVCSALSLYAEESLSKNELLEIFNNDLNSSSLKATAKAIGNQQNKDIKKLTSISSITLEELVKDNATELPEYGVVYTYDNKIEEPLKTIQVLREKDYFGFGSGSIVLVQTQNIFSFKVIYIRVNSKYAEDDLLRGGYYAYAGTHTYTTVKKEKKTVHVFVELKTE